MTISTHTTFSSKNSGEFVKNLTEFLGLSYNQMVDGSTIESLDKDSFDQYVITNFELDRLLKDVNRLSMGVLERWFKEAQGSVLKSLSSVFSLEITCEKTLEKTPDDIGVCITVGIIFFRDYGQFREFVMRKELSFDPGYYYVGDRIDISGITH